MLVKSSTDYESVKDRPERDVGKWCQCALALQESHREDIWRDRPDRQRLILWQGSLHVPSNRKVVRLSRADRHFFA